TTGSGEDAYGEPAVDLPCRVVKRTSRYVTAEGIDALAAAQVWVRPGVHAPISSLFQSGSEAYRVVGVRHENELRRPHHDVLLVDGPFPPTVVVPVPPFVEDVILDGGSA